MMETSGNKPWRILVVDDDDDVQTVTRIVFEEFEYMGRGIELLQATSSQQGLELAKKYDDIAVAIIDVVMETPLSGLELVRNIRDGLGNRLMRIILRTGQPGIAPEKEVVIKYDINDYKEKAELTFQKLQTSLITALRSYNDLSIIEKSRVGLKKIIDASADLFKFQIMRNFATGLLEQLVSLLNLEPNVLLGHISSFAAGSNSSCEYLIYAAMGDYSKYRDQPIEKVEDSILHDDLEKVKRIGRGFSEKDRLVLFFKTSTGASSIVYVRGINRLTEIDEQLMEVFCSNISIAFDNLCLKTEIEDTQRELILSLGEAIDMRSLETGAHVIRVSKLSGLIAKKYGIPEHEVEKLSLIAPMHDVGKITIPDSILNKPGKLTTEEFEIMKTHSMNGYKLLSKSHREIFKSAALIALQHHERYDGLGYPQGLKGEETHIFSRIVALVDVFDALISERIYKKAWSRDAANGYIREQRGKQFDPDLVDIFVENFEEIQKIYDTYENSSQFNE